MIKFLKKTFSHLSLARTLTQVLFVVAIFLVSLMFGDTVAAGVGDVVGTVVGWIIYGFVYVIGQILILIMWILIKVAQYNGFIDSPAVTNGWVIIRDLCNMFFILILLVIAFATILKVESYSLKKMLPTLILMAVLINFSKLICGVIIDFAQVIMLTFVNGFKEAASGNLTNMLGIDKLMDVRTDDPTTPDISIWTILGSYILALIYAVISLVIITAMLAMLVMRMVMIWVYVTLSPIAYLLSAFPQGKQYAAKWWSGFTENVIIGPVLAFFIWLSFSSLGGLETPQDVIAIQNAGTLNSGASIQGTTTGPSASITAAGSPDNMIKFIISIGMLMGGLEISKKLAGETGGALGKVAEKGFKGATKMAKRYSGVEYAQESYKNYQGMKEAKRKEKFAEGGAKIAGMVGQTKETLSYLPKRGAVALNNATINRAGSASQKKREEAEKLRQEAKNVRSSYDLGEVRSGGATWKKNAVSKEWEARDDKGNIRGTVSDDKMKERITKNETSKNTAAEVLESDATKLHQKQDKIDKYKKYGIMAAGAGVGIALTGGIGALAVGGLAAAKGANMGVNAAKKKFGGGGNEDLAMAQSYKADAISKARDKMKFESTEELKNTMTDNSKTSFERHAASMELMNKGRLSESDAKYQKEKILHESGGDKRVKSMLEGAMEKNYVHLTDDFSQASVNVDSAEHKGKKEKERKDIEYKRDTARTKIAGNFRSGEMNLESLSSSAFAGNKELADMIVKALKTSQFVKQYDNLKDQSKKDTITAVLKEEAEKGDAGSYEHKEKLAHIKGMGAAFGKDTNDVQSNKFLSSLKSDQISDIIKDEADISGPFKEALKKALGDVGVSSHSNTKQILDGMKKIFPNAANSLGNTSPTSKAIIHIATEAVGATRISGAGPTPPPPAGPTPRIP